ncbi:MAG: hypothetical protein LBF86_03720 [Helicobacteraceae bacterium]|jgi:hypothetical protein|nr:hypothetical protein [Helicobacteraceae bacterium]
MPEILIIDGGHKAVAKREAPRSDRALAPARSSEGAEVSRRRAGSGAISDESEREFQERSFWSKRGLCSREKIQGVR